MKSLVSLVLVFASLSAQAVSGPAYQNLAIMNAIVQAVVKAEDSSLEGEELLQETDELELAQLTLKNNSTFSILTVDQFCEGEIKIEVASGGMGSNPDYKVAGLKCESEAKGQKSIQWSTIEAKVVKRAKTGKATTQVEVNQTNRRLKLK